MNFVKIIQGVGLAAALALGVSACAYTVPVVSGDKAIITKNNMFLFGMFNGVFVCDVTASGLSNCVENESP